MMDDYQSQVKISSEFFKKEFNDYLDPTWSIIREFAQNSIDAPGTTTISVDISTQGENTVLSFSNNGQPMTREILVDKLLALGASGKDFNAGAVGGFGKAKVILYFCHQSYKIESGNLVVEGQGGNYTLTESTTYFPGTKSTIVIEDTVSWKLEDKLRKFIKYAQWRGEFIINGQSHRSTFRRGKYRRDLEKNGRIWAKVFTNQSSTNQLVVRIGGNPMFCQYVDYDGCVIVDLEGQSVDTLTSNRDSIKYPYSNEISRFVSEVATSRSSALRPARKSRYTRYAGYQLQPEVLQEQLNGTVESQTITQQAASEVFEMMARVIREGSFEPSKNMPIVAKGSYYSNSSQESGVTQPKTQLRSSIGVNFIIDNQVDRKIPEAYLPTGFGPRQKDLALIWSRLCLTACEILGVEKTFSVGFLFQSESESSDTKALAQYLNHEQFGHVLFLSPAIVGKTLKLRWSKSDSHELIMAAVHEVLHMNGYFNHNEAFASALTMAAARAMKHLAVFRQCFKTNSTVEV